MKTEHYESNEYSNRDISFSEIEHVIKQKSPGIDNIPKEVITDRGLFCSKYFVIVLILDSSPVTGDEPLWHQYQRAGIKTHIVQ